MNDRERVGELVRSSGLGMLGDEHPFWGHVLSKAGQEIHAVVSRALGVGALNSVDTTVAKAREVARLPRPKRASAGRIVTADEVASALSDTPRKLAAVCDVLGSKLSTVVDSGAVAKALGELVATDRAALVGRRYVLMPTPDEDFADEPANDSDETGGAA